MFPDTKSCDVTIVGGGFAGLAAALRLHRAGAKIRLIEKRPFFGGRAYSFRDKVTGETLDNGQHLLMGCYHETMKFLEDLGTLDRLHIQENLEISFAEDAKNFHQLRCPNLPAPFHLAVGLMRFKGLNWRDKLQMIKLMRFSKKVASNGDHLDEVSIRTLLQNTQQTEDAIQKFWEPLGLGALNESIELASAQLFTEVVRRALLSKKSDSNLALSSVGLSDLYATPAQEYFQKQEVPLSFQTQILKISREGDDYLLHADSGEIFKSKAVLLAVPPNALAKLLSLSSADFSEWLPQLMRFQSSPIVSINLWIEDFQPSDTMVGLIGSPIHWLFNKAKVLVQEKVTHVTLVVSGAVELANRKKEELVALALQELQRYYPEIRGKRLLHAQLVKEFDATFGTRLGLCRYRPTAATKWEGLYLAGDWTDTGLPATIESAVLSGHRAADLILRTTGH
jgi:hydroxysqualene dehydroxylase